MRDGSVGDAEGGELREDWLNNVHDDLALVGGHIADIQRFQSFGSSYDERAGEIEVVGSGDGEFGKVRRDVLELVNLEGIARHSRIVDTEADEVFPGA